MNEQVRQTGGSANGSTLPFEVQLVTIHYDYLICRRWSEAAAGYVGSSINVARAANTRRNEGGPTVDSRLVAGESKILVLPCQPITVRDDSDSSDVTCRYIELPQPAILPAASNQFEVLTADANLKWGPGWVRAHA